MTTRKSESSKATKTTPEQGDPDAPQTDADGNVSDATRESLENAARNAGYPVTSQDVEEAQQDS